MSNSKSVVMVLMLMLMVMITLVVQRAVIADSSEQVAFKDVKSGHWAEAAIKEAFTKGIINGHPDGTFKPNDPVQVDQFIKMVLLAKGHPVEPVKKGYWAEPYLVLAKNMGIVEEGEFNQFDRPMNRGEMARVLVRVLEEEYSEGYEMLSTHLKDFKEISAGFQPFVLKGYAKGLITGHNDQTYRFQDSSTRAEAAVVISRLMNKSLRKEPVIEKIAWLTNEYIEKFYEGMHTSRTYKIEDEKFIFNSVFSEDSPFYFENQMLSSTLIPDLDRKLNNLIGGLLDDQYFTGVYYALDEDEDEGNNMVFVSYSPNIAFDMNDNYFFQYRFYDVTPFNAKTGWNINTFSDKASISLNLLTLRGMMGEKEINLYHEQKLRDSLIAILGILDGKKIGDYIMTAYKQSNADTSNVIKETKSFGNIQVDMLFSLKKENFTQGIQIYFTFKK